MFDIVDKELSFEDVRRVLEFLEYKVTGSGENWFVIEGRLVVEFDEADKVVPFGLADVNGFQLACDDTVQGIIRSTIYCLELK